VSNRWDKLKADKNASRHDAAQVGDNANLLMTHSVVVALAGQRMVPTTRRATEDAVEVDELEAGQGKSHHGTAENKEENEVVALGEADGVVHLASGGDEAIRGGMSRGHFEGFENTRA